LEKRNGVGTGFPPDNPNYSWTQLTTLIVSVCPTFITIGGHILLLYALGRCTKLVYEALAGAARVTEIRGLDMASADEEQRAEEQRQETEREGNRQLRDRLRGEILERAENELRRNRQLYERLRQEVQAAIVALREEREE
jgi:hypothetical protein